MKVLNLQCQASHVFEGWFASEDDYASQLERELIGCPLCGDTAVHKLPSAPRLNFGASAPTAKAQETQAQAAVPGGSAKSPDSSSTVPTVSPQTDQPSQSQDVMSPEVHHAMQAAWLQMARRVMADTVDVGERFSEEARRMHYGEAELRSIRGQASREETEALIEEGIEVMALPLPAGLKGPLQ